MLDEEFETGADEELSLLETLDHVLDRGLVVAGEMTIAVADIDLIYVGLNVLLGSAETIREVVGGRERRLEALREMALAPAAEVHENPPRGEGA
jgi:gas vesicle structural protein